MVVTEEWLSCCAHHGPRYGNMKVKIKLGLAQLQGRSSGLIDQLVDCSIS